MEKIISRYSKIIVFSLLFIMFCLGFFSLLGDSAIIDEMAHLPAGYTYLKFQDFRLNPEHPPLIKAIAAIPLLFLDLKFPSSSSSWHDKINDQWQVGWEFIYRSGNNPDLILNSARLPLLFLSLILGIFLYRWTNNVFGKKTAIFALFFYVFSPNILAHSRLVTTDLGMTATFFITLYFFYKFLKSPSWKNLLLCALSFGLALLSKFSNIVLIPYLALLSFFFIITSKEKISFSFFLRLKENWLKRFLFFIFPLVFIFAFGFILIGFGYYLFSYHMPLGFFHQGIDQLLPYEGNFSSTKNFLHFLAQNPILRPFSWYFLGLTIVVSLLQHGYPTYFLGQVGESWRYYYPLSFFLKTPISMIVLFLLSIVFLAKSKILNLKSKIYNSKFKSLWQSLKLWIDKNLLEFICWNVIIMFFLIGVASKLNIGLRHILPLYPFLHILSAKYFVKVFLEKKTKFKIAAGSILILWYIATNLFTFPHYLAYFNEFAGGYKNGYKYSVDSNLDWGQDLKRLAKWVEKNKIEKLTLDYFGGSVPEYYLGNKFLPWQSRYGKPPKGYFALSATLYQNSRYYKKIYGIPDYSWLDEQKPIANIGGSILVYKIE